MKRLRGVCGVLLWTLMSSMVRDTGANISGFYGFVGCNMDPEVCHSDEVCVEDCLFGSCQMKRRYQDTYDTYCYDLSTSQLLSLEDEVARLLMSGFSWQDLYTQCVLGNILISHRIGLPYDPDFCESPAVREEIQSQISADALRLLEKYFIEYYGEPEASEVNNNVDFDYPSLTMSDDLYPADERNYDTANYFIPLSKKSPRDEFVQVHKYLKSHKRNSDYDNLYRMDEDFPLSSLDYYQDVDYEQPQMPLTDTRQYAEYEDILKDLSPEELEYLYDYLMEANDRDIAALDYEYAPDYTDESRAYDVEDPVADENSIYDYENPTTDLVPVPSGEVVEDADQPLIEENMQYIPDNDYVTMTPDDANLLGDLLQEKLDVSDLTKDEMERLYKYIGAMIDELFKEKLEAEKSEPEEDTLPELFQNIDNSGAEEVPVENVQEMFQENSNEEKRADGNEMETYDTEESPQHDEMFYTGTTKPVNSKEHYGILQNDVAYLKVRKEDKEPVSEFDAEEFLEKLQNMLGMDPGSLSRPKYI